MPRPPRLAPNTVLYVAHFNTWAFLYTKVGYLTRSQLVVSENMKGKVVLITGASSGIGEILEKVAERAKSLGSPDVLSIRADVSNVEDCKRFVDQTASKAALISFYETMRLELAPEVSITIATLGYTDSEIIRGKHLKDGVMQVDSKQASLAQLSLPKGEVATKVSMQKEKKHGHSVKKTNGFSSVGCEWKKKGTHTKTLPFSLGISIIDNSLARERCGLEDLEVRYWNSWMQDKYSPQCGPIPGKEGILRDQKNKAG
ncbi:hypothetical protein RND71_003387 [Anisodus tanguticus]|uniref:Uncharacterized protein n=1 Tax=Anisodus tanguticus TaxID=243964 RepID=A0AAE1SYJ3_9SOLA|nr:hypothetical protein RND71_003387 [Anisodus tanguticus]